MRTEHRAVYIAHDGREFTVESECQLHEKVLYICEYLESQIDLCWRDITPGEVVRALLERYDINLKL